MVDHYDVVIVGAGMVGSSLACSLIRCDPTLQLAIVEAFPVTASDAALPSFDARSTALSWGSAHFYEKIGLWPSISQHATAINRIQVSDQGLPVAARLDRNQLGLAALGYVVENRKLGRVLLETIVASEQIRLLAPATVTEFNPGKTHSLVRIRQGSRERDISTQLLVVADGSESALRQRMGIHTTVKPDQHAALIANVSVDRAHANTAYERFTESGPIALLPLSVFEIDAHRFALVFHMDEAECQRMLKVSDGEFISRFHSSFGYRAGRIMKVGERSRHTLIQSWSEEQIRRGCVILGNAAHTLNPVAAQGFNLSMRDIMSLTSILCQAHETGDDLGSLSVLQQYLDVQQADQARIRQFTGIVLQLFSMQQVLSRLFRQLGLLCIDFLPTIKEKFISLAAGVRPDL